MPYQTYVSRKSRLLKDFNRSVARIKRVLISRYGEEQANALIRESRQEYEALIPKIPYIGDKNPFLIFLLPASRYLAVYRAIQRQGRTVEDAGQLIYEMEEAELRAIPGLVRRVLGYLCFSRWFIGRLKKRARESQERKYPGGYVLTFIEGNGRDFDYGLDYTECAACKLLSAQNARELAPYVCAVDKIVSEMMGWGMSRTMTLAEGREKCDFRFKKGGKTDVQMPPIVDASL
ncbi:MAG: hypothetical protein C0403_08430 [Desulfobacterium sp.]|nr:hypothetical protein [Desulfobacterium sp.]